MMSTQEEADTCVLLHAANAAMNGYKAVVITAEDTDILVISIAFFHTIHCQLYHRVGTQTRRTYIDIAKVAGSLGEEMCTALIGLHAFTGCDSVSAFAGKGKVRGLKLTKSVAAYRECFTELGQTWQVTDELLHKLEVFTCNLYVSTGLTDVNQCRYQLFCAKRGNMISEQLPPCKDCLFHHAQRANYQAGIWRRSLECNPEVPRPSDCGWMVGDNGDLEILWMTGPPAPSAVLELMNCNCIRSCDTAQCPCIINGLKCTKMCKNQSCDNQMEEETVDDTQTYSEDSDNYSD